MSTFTIYNPGDGMILRSGDVPADQLPHQARAGEAMIAGSFSGATQRIVNGAATPRPALVLAETTGRGWRLSAPPPAGMTARVTGLFLGADPVPVTAVAVALEVAEPVSVTLDAPFPWIPLNLTLTGSDDPIPAGAQILAADTSRMQAHYAARVRELGDQMVEGLLGARTPIQNAQWTLQRQLWCRHLAGTLTPADMTHVGEVFRYQPGDATAWLDGLSARFRWEEMVVLRSIGLETEALARIAAATTPADVIAAKSWAETEAMTGVAETTAAKPP